MIDDDDADDGGDDDADDGNHKFTTVARYGVRQSTTTAAKYEGTWANGLQVILIIFS